MRHVRHKQGPARHQQGATAIEFSIVFALLFAVFWAIISYALPFFLYQTMNHAVAEAARQVVRFENPTPAQATAELNVQLQRFLPATFRDKLVLPPPSIQDEVLTGADAAGNPVTATFEVLTISAEYPGCNTSNHRASCIAPALNLLGTSIPNLGRYVATTQIRLSRKD